MNKKLLIIPIAVISLIIAVVIVGHLSHFIDFCKNKKAVCEYIDRSYDFEYKLQNYKIGKDAYPAPRQEDEFFFHDLTNDIYFKIVAYEEDSLYDDYNDRYNGKIISQDIEEKFPQKQSLDYIIRCFGNYDEEYSSYRSVTCQIVFFTKTIKNDLLNIYEIIEYLKYNYSGINARILISIPKYKEEYCDLFSYRKFKSFGDLNPLYDLQLKLDESAFSTYEEFCSLIQNN